MALRHASECIQPAPRISKFNKNIYVFVAVRLVFGMSRIFDSMRAHTRVQDILWYDLDMDSALSRIASANRTCSVSTYTTAAIVVVS